MASRKIERGSRVFFIDYTPHKINMQNLVSIIVPVYNTEDYLKNCMDSILMQTYQNLEIILVDDGSTDASGNICDRYKDKDARVVVIHQKNRGQSAARNQGIAISKGNWIMFVDSDDKITADCVEVLLRACIDNCATIAQGAACTELKNIIAQPDAEPEIMSGKELMLSNKFDVVVWCKLYKSDIFKRVAFRENIIYEDNEILYRILYEEKRMVFVNKKLYIVTERENSTTRSKFSQKNLILMDLYDEQIQFFTLNREHELKENALKGYYSTLLLFYTKVKELTNSGEYRKTIKKRYRKNYKYFVRVESIGLKTKLLLSICYVCPACWMWLDRIRSSIR